jgi:hypothetical protein
MREALLERFQAEKREALLLLAVGAMALVQVPEKDPATYRAQESARMERVMSSTGGEPTSRSFPV